MQHERARLLQIKYVLCDVAATALAFFLAYWIRDSVLAGYLGRLYPLHSYTWILAIAVVGVPIILGSLRLYEIGGVVDERGPLHGRLPRLTRAIAVEYILFSVVLFSLRLQYVSRLFLFIFFGLSLLLLILARAAWWPVLLRRARRDPLRVLIVGSRGSALELASALSDRSGMGVHVIGFLVDKPLDADWLQGIPVLGRIEQAEWALAHLVVDEVLIAIPDRKVSAIEPLLLLCQESGITARLACDFFPRGSAKPYLEQLEGVPLLTFATTPRNADLLAMKRIGDIIFGTALLILTSPVFLLAALAIKLTSKGPILYRQVRCGLDGKPFTFLKFRSMIDGADEKRKEIAHLNEAKDPIFKILADPRVTPVGRFLRRTSIDELPQLINVLRGEMSLVGPRPPLPNEVERYNGWQRRRLAMKPGLTCLWQVSGRSTLSFEKWVELDLRYIDHWSPWLDLKIMFKTVPAVASLKGAW
jgi:exopolysaccharide biosynthesis polyprenyl glycosylphosphotransferase